MSQKEKYPIYSHTALHTQTAESGDPYGRYMTHNMGGASGLEQASLYLQKVTA